MNPKLYPEFNPELSKVSFEGDGQALIMEFETLDAIAEQVGVTPFTAYGDNRDIPEDFDGDLDELDEVLGDWQEWFAAADGLKTCKSLLLAIELNSDCYNRLEQPEFVVADLKALAVALEQACNQGASFRLQVV